MHEADPIAWHAWDAAAFARAQADGLPILLFLTAGWCEASSLMEDTSYRDPRVAALVREAFVPIKVDADRRPDVNDQYNVGGWPSTVLLTPEGAPLSGMTYVDADRLLAGLERVKNACRDRSSDIAALLRSQAEAPSMDHSADVTSREQDPPETIERISAEVFEQFDPEHGGFGTAPKFPHTVALRFALQQYLRSEDRRLHAMIIQSLDAMIEGELFDHGVGGFFHYCEGHDWTRPHVEKLLDENAQLLRLYLDAGAVLDRAAYREVAIETLRYLHTTLADHVEGGFGGSQRADSAYYALSDAERATRPPPAVDRTLYVDANCEMISVYLRAAELLDDGSLRAFAIQSLERVMLTTYRPGVGLAHWTDGHETGVRGLLNDQIRAAAALLDAYDVTARVPYPMLAEELMQFCLRTMWDPHGGGFFDRVGGEATAREHGRLRECGKPFAANCLAARVLLRLASLAADAAYQQVAVAADRPDYRSRALEALGSQSAAARDHGPQAASYALALHDLDRLGEPVYNGRRE